MTLISILACIFDSRKMAPLITVYRTGKYIITGPTSEEELFDLRERFLKFLSDMDVIENATDEWFAVQNYVCTEDLGQTLNLNALAIGLGLERTEYEPEQFPGLIYRPEGYDGVVLLFATGRVVITGCRSVDAAEKTFSNLESDLKKCI
ncbi:TATA-box-binding protein C [Halobacterium salinarum]|uniref:TATA-box-binding protein n=1 Tax=Halobacterium salinarum TaxID=2242 RepID=UPI0025565EC3|nr:TATA-box-binding protein C [Halobacterium salinarum]MDL0139893.1 TATA-box-binding protein C [Halobacterium salinarum]